MAALAGLARPVPVARALVVALAVVFPAVMFGWSSTEAAVPVPLVCLDPGHGGSDPGAVNGELHEADINLDVAKALAARLAGDEIDSVLTRTDDDSTKSSRDRYEFCNAQNATILVSVHTNSWSDPLVDGRLAIYFHSDDKLLAQALHDAMWSKLQPTAPDPTAFTDFDLKRDALGVLLKSDMPAATAEPVFMSHPDEAARLTEMVSDCSDAFDNSCRRAQIVEALYNGIVEYLASSPPDGEDDGPGNGKGPPEGRGPGR